MRQVPREAGVILLIVWQLSRMALLSWADLSLTLAGALYTGGLLGYAPLLASVQETVTRGGGQAWMLMVLLGHPVPPRRSLRPGACTRLTVEDLGFVATPDRGLQRLTSSTP